jgi:ribosome-binding protein aMBF1 (putative translation factor)
MTKYYHEGNTLDCEMCGTGVKELVAITVAGEDMEVCEQCAEECLGQC